MHNFSREMEVCQNNVNFLQIIEKSIQIIYVLIVRISALTSASIVDSS